MPLDTECNKLILDQHPDHKQACRYAKLALAVWATKPTEFAGFHDWLMHGKGLSTQDVTLTTDPLGERLYGTWSQLGMTKRRSDKESGDDAWLRRVFYNLLLDEETKDQRYDLPFHGAAH